MDSFEKVNYSIRPNKSIERDLVLSGLGVLIDKLQMDNPILIGFGSVWFSDFIIAHRQLGIDRMVSLEKSEIGYSRAKFSKPFKSIEVIQEISTDAIPKFCKRDDMVGSPWIIWFDYDYEMGEEVLEDFNLLVEGAPEDSVIIVTYDAQADKYGPLKKRQAFLRKIFKSIYSSRSVSRERLNNEMPELLNELGLDYLRSYYQKIRRPGEFVPTFSMVYHDTATMATLGGVLAGPGKVALAKQIASKSKWPGIQTQRIETPHLTVREILALQAELPRRNRLTQASINRIGFALTDRSLKSYNEYYRLYPLFAKVMV